MTDDTLPMTDERAAFEAWWKGDLVDWRGHQSVPAQHAWDAWQARALASPAAPHPAQQAGDMVMVPRVPTEEMMYRGGEATSGLVDWGADSFPDDAPGNLASAVYAAMLTAAPAIPAQQAGQPEDAKDAAMAFAVEVLHRVREFVIVHGPDGAWQAACNRCDEAIERLGAAMSSPTAKKGE